jgi:hypothetical protein
MLENNSLAGEALYQEAAKKASALNYTLEIERHLNQT